MKFKYFVVRWFSAGQTQANSIRFETAKFAAKNYEDFKFLVEKGKVEWADLSIELEGHESPIYVESFGRNAR